MHKGKYSFSISSVIIKVELVKRLSINTRVIKIIYTELLYLFVISKCINQYSLVTIYIFFSR